MSTKMQTVGRDGAKQIREMLELVLVPNSEARGLTVTIGRITFSDSGARLGLSFEITAGAEERRISQAAREWNYLAPMLGLPQGAVGKVVTIGPRSYRIDSINPRATRFPVSCTCVSGKPVDGAFGHGFKFTTTAIAKAIETGGLREEVR